MSDITYFLSKMTAPDGSTLEFDKEHLSEMRRSKHQRLVKLTMEDGTSIYAVVTFDTSGYVVTV